MSYNVKRTGIRRLQWWSNTVNVQENVRWNVNRMLLFPRWIGIRRSHIFDTILCIVTVIELRGFR